MSTRRSCPAPPSVVRRAVWLGGASLLSLFALAALACDERPRPWEGKTGPARESTTASAAPPRPPATSLALVDPSEDAGGGDGGVPEIPSSPVRVGGPWVRCYGNFKLSGEPVKDVTRLSFLCGPENGMRRLSTAPIEGSVTEGGPGVTGKFKALRGACYRVFAAAERSVRDLDVAVQSSRGATIASDGSEDAWPIVQPDRPFCPLEDDTVTVEITARAGSGRFAAEVWLLKTPEPKKTAPEELEVETYEDL